MDRGIGTLTNEWFEMVCQSALGHRTSQEETYDLARLVLQRGIPGDFVECGVYAGASCALMAQALIDAEYSDRSTVPYDYSRSNRRVHLFDSFAGIPPPGPHDHQLRANVGGESACSFEDVKANMRAWGIPMDLLVWHPGYFQDTIPLAVGNYVGRLTAPLIVSIALLRLDGDLYESTRVCLDCLYPLVSPGGYVIIDDYDLDGCREAVHEYIHPAPAVWRKWE